MAVSRIRAAGSRPPTVPQRATGALCAGCVDCAERADPVKVVAFAGRASVVVVVVMGPVPAGSESAVVDGVTSAVVSAAIGEAVAAELVPACGCALELVADTGVKAPSTAIARGRR